MLWSLLHFLSNKSWQGAVFSHKMYLHVDWHITLSDLSHPCLKCCLFKHLTRDKSLACVCFSLLFGPSEQELLWQSWARKEPTEKKQRDGQTSSCELLPMLWQGLQQWLMWATGPGQTLGFHSGCNRHVPGCVADGNEGKEIEMKPTDMWVPICQWASLGGKNTEPRHAFMEPSSQRTIYSK